MAGLSGARRLVLLAAAAVAAAPFAVVSATAACASTIFGYETLLTGFSGAADATPSDAANCVALDGAAVRTGYLVTAGGATSCCVKRGVYFNEVCLLGCDSGEATAIDFYNAGDACYTRCYESPNDLCLQASTFAGVAAPTSDASYYGLDATSALNLNPQKTYALNTGTAIRSVYGLAATTTSGVPKRRRDSGAAVETPSLYCAGRGVLVAGTDTAFACSKNACGDAATAAYAAFDTLEVGSYCFYDCFTESTCATGYTGATCETAVDNCVFPPCANGGTCTSTVGVGTYNCTCAAGYAGVNCLTDIDECVGSACTNGATCVDGVGSYTCTCASTDYSGTYCEVLPSPAFCDLPDTQAAFTRVLTTLVTEDDAYLVTAASFTFYNISVCQASGNCFYQNANEPYGFFTVPNGPYEPAHNASAEPTRTLPYASWRLATDEAILIYGCTPPLATYFGLTAYVVDTYYNAAWLKVFGSMADTLNNHRIATFDNAGANASSAFSANFVTVLAADPNVVADLVTLLTGTLAVPYVNVLEIPAAGWNLTVSGSAVSPVNMGLEQYDDDFTLLLRVIQADNATAFAVYEASSPISVLRITRSASAPARTDALALYGPPQLISRATPSPTTAYNELLLADAKAYIIANLTATYAATYAIRQVNYTANLLGAEVDYGGYCYGAHAACNGDNRDTRYMATAGAVIFPASTTFNVVVGANHHATGNAQFSNVVLYNANLAVGVVGVRYGDYSGSADAYLAGTPYAALSPYLFVYTFARTCGTDAAYCVVVPSSGFPALANSAAGFFVTRGYVRPDTGVGSAISPNPLLPPTHLRFVKS